jgi:site-specific DNA recombinase
MVHTFASRGNKRYRYYTCTNAIKNGRCMCPVGSLPAGEIEKAVVDQIRCIGRDPDVLGETLRQACARAEAAIERLTAERRIIERGLGRCHAEIRRLATSEPATSTAAVRIADLTDQVGQSERRLKDVNSQIAESQRDLVTNADVVAAFADFDNIWSALSPREQVRLINLLVHRVEFDAADSSIEVAFYPSGIKALAHGEVDQTAVSATTVEDAA